MANYEILENHSIYNLQILVNKKMSDGYSLAGGPFIVEDITTDKSDRNDYSVIEVRTIKRNYCQAVYKP